MGRTVTKVTNWGVPVVETDLGEPVIESQWGEPVIVGSFGEPVRFASTDEQVIAANTDNWWDMLDITALRQGIDGSDGQPSVSDPVGVVLPRTGQTAEQLIAGRTEKATNGDFATDSDWTKGTGWSIADGKATLDGTNVSNSSLVQNVSGSANEVNIIEVTVSGRSGGASAFIYWGNSQVVTLNSNGTTNTVYVWVTGTQNLSITGNAGVQVSIENISVKSIPLPALISPSTGARPTYLSGGGVLLDGVDDGFDVSEQLTGVEYVIAAVKVGPSPASTAHLTAAADLVDSNGIRLFSSTSWREPTAGSSAGDFSNGDGNTFVNGVDTPAFTNNEMHIAEFFAGSSTEKLVGTVGLAGFAGRYLNGEILGFAVRTSVPSTTEQTALRNAFASRYGVTL